jgi:hypothetical protein
VKVALARTLSGWAPGDDEAIRVSRRWEPGEIVIVDLKKTRVYKSLKRYQALLTLVFENSPKFKSRDQVHQYLKIRAGHATRIEIEGTDQVLLLADSIDYDTLDELEFQEVWSRVKDVVCDDIIPGLKKPELELEILKLCGLAGGSR